VSEGNSIWEKIVKVAQADGRITTEETNLIKTILQESKRYEDVLAKALEDHKINAEEKMNLIDLRARILDKAYREASQDQKISDDEYAIIEQTLKILHQLELEEDEFLS